MSGLKEKGNAIAQGWSQAKTELPALIYSYSKLRRQAKTCLPLPLYFNTKIRDQKKTDYPAFFMPPPYGIWLKQLYTRYYGPNVAKNYLLFIHDGDSFDRIVTLLKDNGCLTESGRVQAGCPAKTL